MSGTARKSTGRQLSGHYDKRRKQQIAFDAQTAVAASAAVDLGQLVWSTDLRWQLPQLPM
jgi:hypothetical protein